MPKSHGLIRDRAPPVAPAYESDVYSWAMHQAQLLREGRVAEADLANIAEELADLGRSERKELRSALARVIQHLLKWDFQPSKRTGSWQKSINIHRTHARQNLRDNPGLKSELDDVMRDAYELAIAFAAKDTGLSRKTFPASCPYAFDVIMSREIGAGQE